jgi:hypothetical protein
MSDVFLGYEEFFVQTADGQLRYKKVNIYGYGATRLNSDRLGVYTNISKQQFTSYRIELVYDWSLDGYEQTLVQAIRNWEETRRLHWYPQSGRIESVDIIFDLLFFWRSLATATVSRAVTSGGFLALNIAKGSFSGPVGTLVDASLEAAFEPVLKNAFRIANIRSGWALDIATGVATQIGSEKVSEIILPPGGTVWPPAPEAVHQLNAVLAFRRHIGSAALSSFHVKWFPGQQWLAGPLNKPMNSATLASADSTNKPAATATQVAPKTKASPKALEVKLPANLKF